MAIYLAAAVAGTLGSFVAAVRHFQDRDDAEGLEVDADVGVDVEVDVNVEAEPLRRFHPRRLLRLAFLWPVLAAAGWMGVLAGVILRGAGVGAAAAAAVAGLAVLVLHLRKPMPPSEERDFVIYLPHGS